MILDDDYAGSADLIARFPQLNRMRLHAWSAKCIYLGRGSVRTKPNPAHRSRALYHVGDVVEALRQCQPTPPAAVGFVTQPAAREAFPALSSKVLLGWCRRICPPLGRVVQTEPGNLPVLSRNVNLADVQAAAAHLREALPDQFKDLDGIDIASTEFLSRSHGIAEGTWSIWERDGCPAIGGKPLVVRRLWMWGRPRFKRYIRQADVDRIVAGSDQPPADPARWCSLDVAEAMGFDANFLSRHSDTTSPARTRPPVPHPSLNRLIRVDRRRLSRSHVGRDRNGGDVAKVWHHWTVTWSRADLMKILNAAPPPADLWVAGPRAVKEYALTRAQLDTAVQSGRVRREQFAVRDDDEQSRPVVTWLYFRPHLANEHAHMRGRGLLPKPGTPERVHVDGRGVRWWPESDIRAFLHITHAQVLAFRKSCKFLAGQPMSMRVIERPLWNTAQRATRHYREDERDLIYRRMNGLPDDVVTPSDALPGKRSKRGRPGVSPVEERRRRDLLVRWKRANEAGVTKAEFCREESIKPTELKLIQIWSANRKTRGLQKPPSKRPIK